MIADAGPGCFVTGGDDDQDLADARLAEPMLGLHFHATAGACFRAGKHDQVSGMVEAIEEFGLQVGTGGEAGEISEDAFGSGLESGAEELLEDGLDEGGEAAVGGPTVGEEGVVVPDGVDPEVGAQPGGDEATP